MGRLNSTGEQPVFWILRNSHALHLAAVLFLLLVSGITVGTRYWQPESLFWDENYHVASAHKELAGVMYMENHPPLGKMLIALGEAAVGANDDLVPAAQCEVLAERAGGRGAAVTLKVYEGAWHGWDGDYSGDFNHRALNRTYRLQPDAAVTAMSQADVMAFLQPLLKLPPAADKR